MADEIPPADGQAALERILSSPGFATAGRGSRFLRYVVEQTLAGNRELKEFSLGVDVFDRGDTYDPRVDSIVRVEAGRVRTKLDEYYNGVGKDDPVRISLPRGGYVPQFERYTGSGTTKVVPYDRGVVGHHLSGARAWPIVILAVAIVLAIWFVWRQPSNDSLTIAVLAFEEYSGTPEDARLAAEITDGVTSELARLGTIGVASHTSAMQFSGVRKPLKEIAQALNADVVLEAEVKTDGEGLHVVARMVNARIDRKIWVGDFPGTRADLRDLSRRIAAGVSAAALAKRPASR